MITAVESRQLLNFTGWKPVHKGVDLEADLESSPLEIKTGSPLGSNEVFSMSFQRGGYRLEGFIVKIQFTSTPRYQLPDCLYFWTDFPTELPTESDLKVWRITLTRRTSGIRLLIHCNEVEVLNFTMSNSTCSRSWWIENWSWDEIKTVFYYDDTASDFYRGKPLEPVVLAKLLRYRKIIYNINISMLMHTEQ